MSLFKRLTGRHPAAGDAAASPEKPLRLDKDPGLKLSIIEIVKQGNPSLVFEKLLDGGTALLNETNDNKQTLLHIAAELGHIEVVKLLLLHRLVNIDAQDAKGQTPLHLAAHHRKLDVCRLLVERVRIFISLEVDRLITSISGR